MSPFFDENEVAGFVEGREHGRAFAGSEFVGVLDEEVRGEHDLDDVCQ